jgi:hypothetical protein
MGSGHSGDEELGAVGVGARVRHRQQAGNVVLELEALIGELGTVDALATTTLRKEILSDERATFHQKTKIWVRKHVHRRE